MLALEVVVLTPDEASVYVHTIEILNSQHHPGLRLSERVMSGTKG